MRPSATDRPGDPAGGLGVERWRHDDLAVWLKDGLDEARNAAPGGRVWRGIEQELTPPRPSGWLRRRHAYASLGSLIGLAYALSFGAILVAQRGAGAEMACATGCLWDRLSDDEIARQAGPVSAGVDAYPGWVFRVRRPRMDRDTLRSERYEQRYRLEWGSAPDLMAVGLVTADLASIEMD